MVIEGLKQAPFNYTLMGAVRGALDHYGVPVSDAYLYGATGQAFMMNIHRELCPSGPYCWNRDPFFRLLANVGIAVTELGFHHAETPPEQRAASEERLRAALDRGAPCMLVNMEYQLITGYDDTGFLTAQPWPGMGFPPAHLAFGTWSELCDEVHMDFYILDRVEPAERAKAVRAALAYAVDLWRHPVDHTSEDYGVGPNAYQNWVEAVHRGHGASHGNWWNGTVWAECRAHAASFLKEVGDLAPDAEALSAEYAAVADLVARCSHKEMPAPEKDELLRQAAARERACIQRMEAAL
ncbi:MAG: BtrH N-terminal domain-containing protein [Chthonomonadales bacterium]|nr:BtrH N-terminal domain-containing protein [Chthonomonadales bacterium]